MVPYELIDGSAPLMEMFAVHGFQWGKYTVAVGSIAGLSVSLLGSLFPMPRVIYAMARDGLLFRCRTRPPQGSSKDIYGLGLVFISMRSSLD